MFFKIKKSIDKKKLNKGFSFVEIIISVAVFLVIVVAVYSSYISIFNVVFTSRAKIDAIDLINEQLEIIRNMPYADVGIYGGIPSGVLIHKKTLSRGSSVFSVLTTVRNIDDPFDGLLGGSPNDTAPADFKIVEIEIKCDTCKNFIPMSVTTRVAPKSLENNSVNGALFVKVFDASGNAVSGASVRIENNNISPAIIIDDITNSSGMLQIVDVPPGINAYEITVTKSGYSTDKTYVSSVSNTNPTKLYATVVTGQVTQLSFVIDKLGSLKISSVSSNCDPVSSVNFSIIGGKNIGINPVVLKYSENNLTDENGNFSMSNMEWDSYTFTNTDTIYDFVGFNPLSPVILIPGSSQNINLIVSPKTPKTILVTVRDSSTNLPLSDVSVTLSKSGYSSTKMTGEGFLGQTDWSGGSGQATSSDQTKYLLSDGNIIINEPSGDLVLKNVFGSYVSNGWLISSTFDTGALSNFQKIYWNPIDEPLNSGVKLQIATNNDGGNWNFTGPDGTENTYYTNVNQNIYSGNNGNRYLRYKLFLGTTSTVNTPNISDIYFTFTLSCTPPGQVYFSGLSNGTYVLNFSKDGYTDQTTNLSVNSNWQIYETSMQPN